MDKIDFVVTWVDGNDPKWKAEKAKYQNNDEGDQREERYREWDNLQYWFRAIEEYAPWYNSIHFVTFGHVPAWLKTDHPKLHIVNHEDYIPKEYLPTFSARPIEFYLHKIPGLSDKFVYFNDDMFITSKVSPDDFFHNGLPRESAILNISIPPVRDAKGNVIEDQNLYLSSLYNVFAINRHFKKNATIKHNLSKWINYRYGLEQIRTLLLLPWGDFAGFADTHLPYSLLKTTFDDVWKMEEATLKRACEHKFRMSTDVSGRLITWWQIASGHFYPRRVKDSKFFQITDNEKNNQEIFEAIKKKKYKMICINDKVSNGLFVEKRDQLKEAFETLLPTKSSFEA